MVQYIFSFFIAFLIAFAALLSMASVVFGRGTRDRRTLLVLGILSGLVVCTRLDGLPLARWVIGVNADFSIPLMALLVDRIWWCSTGSALLDRRAIVTGWVFGAVGALVLYPLALGIGRFDPYGLGWEYSWLFAFLFTITVLLLLTRNRFGVVLVVCIGAFNLHLLESTNLWDYLIDPFFALASLVGLAVQYRRVRDHLKTLFA